MLRAEKSGWRKICPAENLQTRVLKNGVGRRFGFFTERDILRDEHAHVDWLEEQIDQIAQMGSGIYLCT